jgi:hypothetical protein
MGLLYLLLLDCSIKKDDANKAKREHGECSVKSFGRKLKWL